MKSPLIDDLSRVLSTFAKISGKVAPPIDGYVMALAPFELSGAELAEVATRMYAEFENAYGRLPMPSDFVRLAQEITEKSRAPKIVDRHLLSPDEIQQRRRDTALMAKSLRLTLSLPRAEWKTVIESAFDRIFAETPDSVYQCERCQDTGLLQVYGHLGKSIEKHAMREKQPITRIESEIVPNSPYFEFPYPELIDVPPEGTTRLVARCSCSRADRYMGLSNLSPQ